MKKSLGLALVFALIASFPTQGLAVGSSAFENASFSAKSLAQSNAVVAQADEPAAISYNPAGIVGLKGLQIQANDSFLSMITHVSTEAGDHPRSTGTIDQVPTGYVTVNPGPVLNDRVAFGVGMDSPFGLSNQWDSNDPIVHYTGWKNYLKMYTI
ncbi:MAG TPA: outer membrane protein transport protein, partial [Candidatus Omnitrophota bacterium]|nr:outer membrane protein transport protein [Candidatus Omnitrophota bacterium]